MNEKRVKTSVFLFKVGFVYNPVLGQKRLEHQISFEIAFTDEIPGKGQQAKKTKIWRA